MNFESFIQEERVKEVITEGMLDPVYAMIPVAAFAPVFTSYLKTKGVNVIEYLMHTIPAYCFTTYWEDACELPDTISLNSSVRVIGEGAFKCNNSFKKIFLSADLAYVGEEAFASCDSNLIFIYPKSADHLKNVDFKSNWAGGKSYIIKCSDKWCKVAENGIVSSFASMIGNTFQSTP